MHKKSFLIYLFFFLGISLATADVIYTMTDVLDPGSTFNSADVAGETITITVFIPTGAPDGTPGNAQNDLLALDLAGVATNITVSGASGGAFTMTPDADDSLQMFDNGGFAPIGDGVELKIGTRATPLIDSRDSTRFYNPGEDQFTDDFDLHPLLTVGTLDPTKNSDIAGGTTITGEGNTLLALGVIGGGTVSAVPEPSLWLLALVLFAFALCYRLYDTCIANFST